MGGTGYREGGKIDLSDAVLIVYTYCPLESFINGLPEMEEMLPSVVQFSERLAS